MDRSLAELEFVQNSKSAAEDLLLAVGFLSHLNLLNPHKSDSRKHSLHGPKIFFKKIIPNLKKFTASGPLCL